MGTTTCAAASSTSAQVQPPRKRRQQGMSSSLLQLAKRRLPAPSRDEAAGSRTPLGCTFGWIFGCTLGFLALGAAAGAVAAGAAAAGAIGPKVPPTS